MDKEKAVGKRITADESIPLIEVPRDYKMNTMDTPDGVYAKVQFSGNFGFMCGEFQEFTRYNLTHKQAEQLAWSAFGMCGHTVSAFDQDGNLIEEWT
jgi:hypothetical protein